MMTISVQAIYENGTLKLLEPLSELAEGQTVQITIASFDHEKTSLIRTKLSVMGLLVEDDSDTFELTAEERDHLGQKFLSQQSIEEQIDEERGLY